MLIDFSIGCVCAHVRCGTHAHVWLCLCEPTEHESLAVEGGVVCTAWLSDLHIKPANGS